MDFNSNNTFFHNNFTLGSFFPVFIQGGTGNLLDNGYPSGGNWWSNNPYCQDTKQGPLQDQPGSDGIGDTPYSFDRYPFKERSGWGPTNQALGLSGLNQYKSDGLTSIAEGATTTEDVVTLKATVADPEDDQVKFQVELKEKNQDFNEQDLLESGFVDSGSEVVITKQNLIDGQYHWQARALDDKGNPSAWQEFGVEGNVDFVVEIVLLYTQVKSPYPSEALTDSWYNEPYAEGTAGDYDCGSKIYQCGCAITSAVMIARYYLDEDVAQGKDINPKEINDWLRNELGGYVNGDVNWIAIAKYTGYRIKYDKTDKTTNNYVLLDEKLNNNQPVIAKAKSGRGGINRQHFFVIDNKLASTYNVKDPGWYNTKTLNEITNISNNVRSYENGFDGLRIYKKGDGIAQSAITFALGSPAELLVTDPQGRKVGKDENGVEYQEIFNAWYFEDGFDDPTGEILPSQERNKLIQILEPIDGEYRLQVIGTGKGDYTLESTSYDTQGNTQHQEFSSQTAPGYTAQYNLSFDFSNSANTTIELFDETPPEAEVYFNPETQQLKIKGIDNTTVDPTVSVAENDKQTIYQIQDEAGNATKLFFKKLRQEGKEIKAELEAIQYNNESVIKLSKTELKYEWSLNKDRTIKELNQRIKTEDQFEIKAKYSSQKEKTEIEFKTPAGKEKQTLSEFVIIKLITESGVLSFEF